MGLFDKVKKTTIESRRYEEKLYEVALEEVEAGEVRKGLYAKALSKADGDKEKADGIYLKLRVQSIMDDIESEQINRRDNENTILSSKQNNIINSEDIEIDRCKRILNKKGYTVKDDDNGFTIYIKPAIMGSVKGKASSVEELCQLAVKYNKLVY